jgi:DNA-binding transcriptional LysR family regulator
LEVLPLTPGVEGLAAIGPKIDLAITCEDFLPSGFRRQALFEDEEVLVLSKSRPRKRLALAPFLASPQVSVAESRGQPDPVDTWLATLGHTRRIAAVVPHYVMALQLVSQSGLMAVIPKRLVNRFSGPFGLAFHRLPLELGPFTEYLLHPERVDQDPGNLWLRQALLKLFYTGKAPGGRSEGKPSGPQTVRKARSPH